MKNFTLGNLRRANIDYYGLKADATGRHFDLQYPSIKSFPGMYIATDGKVATELMYILESVTSCATDDFDRDFYEAVDDWCASHPSLARKMKNLIKELAWGC